VTGESAVEAMLALHSARVVNLKPGRVGGFQSALAIHDHCARAGVAMLCGGMLESGIGRAYNVALASLPNFTEPGDLSPSSRYWARDVIVSPWTMDGEGRVRVPLERTGIGVEVDAAFVDDLTVRQATFRAR
jgi:O-succinylbenzoate synthase